MRTSHTRSSLLEEDALKGLLAYSHIEILRLQNQLIDVLKIVKSQQEDIKWLADSLTRLTKIIADRECALPTNLLHPN